MGAYPGMNQPAVDHPGVLLACVCFAVQSVETAPAASTPLKSWGQEQGSDPYTCVELVWVAIFFIYFLLFIFKSDTQNPYTKITPKGEKEPKQLGIKLAFR